jgi:uncharacterized protein YdaU (DUF1376 family)
MEDSTVSAKKLPWFKFFAGDYLLDSGVDSMPREAEGLLIRMWCICHIEGSCPADPGELARKTRCSLQYVLLSKPLCESLFELRGDRLYSRRMEEEKRRSQQARENASKRFTRSKQSTSANGSTNRLANGSADCSADGSAQSQSQSQNKNPLCSFHSDAECSHPGNGSTTGSERFDLSSPPIKKKQKPAAADPRYTKFVKILENYWRDKNTIPLIFDKTEGKNLNDLLAADQHLTAEQFASCLQNRAESDGVAHGERPRVWLGNVTKYAGGPLDRFGRTKIRAGVAS